MGIKKVIKKIKNGIHKFINAIIPYYSPKTLLLSSLHAIWMIIFSLFWLVNINYFDGFEFMNNIYDYKKLIEEYIPKDEYISNIDDDYLLLDVSKNSQILSKGGLGIENTVITDRKELLYTLEILNSQSDSIKYIICDIYFDKNDFQTDSSLQTVINELNAKNKIVLSTFFEDTVDVLKPIVFNSNKGVAQYKSSFLNTEFLKFSYYFKGEKQVPLIAYEAITNDSLIKKKFLGATYYKYKSGGFCLNTIIPPLRYTSSDIYNGEKKDINEATYTTMGLYNLSPEGYPTKGKVVVIGDFSGEKGDVHHSIADQITGSVILINAYESLLHKDNRITISLLITLFIFFIIISHHSFYNKRVKKHVKETNIQNKFLLLILKNINYICIFTLTIICMLAYNFYINLFILLTYFIISELITNLLHFLKIKK